jgi:hypothetical protein
MDSGMPVQDSLASSVLSGGDLTGLNEVETAYALSETFSAGIETVRTHLLFHVLMLIIQLKIAATMDVFFRKPVLNIYCTVL